MDDDLDDDELDKAAAPHWSSRHVVDELCRRLAAEVRRRRRQEARDQQLQQLRRSDGSGVVE